MRQGIFILFSIISFLDAKENLDLFDRRGRAFYSAYDYDTADSIYNKLSKQPLPEWQKTRIIYNLGTIALAKEETETSFLLFSQIDPEQLTTPQNVFNLFFNQGMAYLKAAERPSLPASLSKQIFFIRKSLEALKKAQKMNCFIYFQTTSHSSTKCSSTTTVKNGLQRAAINFSRLKQQEFNEWLEEASAEMQLLLINSLLEMIINHLTNLKKTTKDLAVDSSYSTYFYQQINRLSPIWELLKKQEIHKKEINFAHSYYDLGIQSLLDNDLASSTRNFFQVNQIILSLLGEAPHLIEKISLANHLLLMRDSINPEELKKFADQINALKGFDTIHKSFEPIYKDIQKKIDHFISDTDTEILFYLWAIDAIIARNENIKKTQLTAPLVLKKALSNAKRALNLLFLYELSSQNFQNNAGSLEQLKNQQKAILEEGSLFIPSFISDQKKFFKEKKDFAHPCFRFNNEDIIAHFDRGYKTAQSILNNLSSSPFEIQTNIRQQEEVIQNWQYALEHLLKDPLSSSQTQKNEASLSEIKNINENFGIIQEMFLEDKKKSEPTIQDSDVW